MAGAVCAAAEQTGVPALARMPRATRSGWHVDLGTDAAPARAVQRAPWPRTPARPRPGPARSAASTAQDNREQLRWLVPPRRMFTLG